MTGKEKCKYLKELRAKIAAENGIDGFEYKECLYQGECEGTCPACDAEAEALQQALVSHGKKITPQPITVPDGIIHTTMGIIAEDDYFLHGDVAIDDNNVTPEITEDNLQEPIDRLPGKIITKNPVNNSRIDYAKTRGKISPSAFNAD